VGKTMLSVFPLDPFFGSGDIVQGFSTLLETLINAKKYKKTEADTKSAHTGVLLGGE